MNYNILILIASQLLFTTGDILGRTYMKSHGFHLTTFLTPWFIIYFLVRTVAMFGQLYIFSSVELGKTMAGFGAVGIILSNVLGLLLLNEVLSTQSYIGVSLAVLAFLVLAFK